MSRLFDPRLGGVPPGALGGKAATLWLLAGEFKIPPFICLEGAELSANDAETLTEWIGSVSAPHGFAVRSSANVEDSADSAFAGLFETILAVPGSRVPSAIAEVVSSTDSERVQAYLLARGAPTGEVRVGVLVQVMLDPDSAGVAFSRGLSGGSDVLIEAVYGLGERLVQGVEDPDSYLVDRSSLKLREQRSVAQRVAAHPVLGRGVVTSPVPPVSRSRPKLSHNRASSIAKLALEVESALHYESVDIEWALVEDELWLLQARPVTTLGGAI